MTHEQLKRIFEGAIMASGQPMSVERLIELFDEQEQPTKETVREILTDLAQEYTERSIELKELASGFTFQVKAEYAPWIGRIWEERPGRYSRALLETLALIAYRQPITRAEIEDIRGVAVSSHIIKTLQEREWIRIVGYRDVPGKPGLYATTRQFLDHFNLKSLDELPTLAEINEIPDGEIPALTQALAEQASTDIQLDISLEATTDEATLTASISEETPSETGTEKREEINTQVIDTTSAEDTTSEDPLSTSTLNEKEELTTV